MCTGKKDKKKKTEEGSSVKKVYQSCKVQSTVNVDETAALLLGTRALGYEGEREGCCLRPLEQAAQLAPSQTGHRQELRGQTIVVCEASQGSL